MQPAGGVLPARAGLCAAVLALAGCVDSGATAPAPVSSVNYDGVETRLLDDDLVNFRVQMSGVVARDDVAAYARCAAAQYALIRGFGFARHVRTNVQEQGGVWVGDAVYTISPALPRGLQTLDAEVMAAACAEQGIPTV
jgi:hypothetical protein